MTVSSEYRHCLFMHSAVGAVADALRVREGRAFVGRPILVLVSSPCGRDRAIPLHYTAGNEAANVMHM